MLAVKGDRSFINGVGKHRMSAHTGRRDPGNGVMQQQRAELLTLEADIAAI